MKELSATLVAEEKGCGRDEKVEEGTGSDAGRETGAGGVAGTTMSEKLDLDQVKGRMLTMAGLFDIWKGEVSQCTSLIHRRQNRGGGGQDHFFGLLHPLFNPLSTCTDKQT